ncbi:MAG: hypothetical protein ACJ07L_04625 [Opitutales bacterium]
MRPILPQIIPLALISLGTLTAVDQLQAQHRPPSPMNAMDHGPFVSATISSDPQSTNSIIAHRLRQTVTMAPPLRRQLALDNHLH